MTAVVREEGGIGAHDRLLGRTEEEGLEEEGRHEVGNCRASAKDGLDIAKMKDRRTHLAHKPSERTTLCSSG